MLSPLQSPREQETAIDVSYSADGQTYVSSYEPGDLGLLQASGRGEALAGKAGD
ncbi:hypothetical protein [Roseomonas sp. WA12]